MDIGKVDIDMGVKIFFGILLAIALGIGWFLWELGIIPTLMNCDTTDYSPIIKKVAVPMQQELEKFYIKNKRFPNTQERDELLEKAGCKMEGNVCVYEGKRMIFRKASLNSYNGDYEIDIKMGNTGCQSGIYKYSGSFVQVTCSNAPCINLRQ